MRTTREMITAAALAMFMLLVFPAIASGPPVAAISCRGCVGIVQISGNSYTAYANAGATITLSANPGYPVYFWTNGLSTNSTQEIKVTVVSGLQYALTVTDYGGVGGTERSDTKNAQISLASTVSQGTCPPDLADISVDSDYLNRIFFAVGDKFSVKTDFSESQCGDIAFHWESDDPGVFIENPAAKETQAVIKAKPFGKNPVIKATITNGLVQREKNTTITIVDNTAPIVKGRYTYTTPLSHTEFEVSCGACWTGSGYNEYGDFIAKFVATLLDMKGQIISTGTATAKRGETLSDVALKAGDEGEYVLKVAATDSHGLSTTIAEPIFVSFGNTEEDVPLIVVNDTIYCETGEPCSIDASQTYDHDLGISFRFQSIADSQSPENLYNTGGALCTTFVCNTVFKYPYTYQIKISAAYIRSGKVADRHSERTATVIVSEAGAQSPAQTPQIIAKPQTLSTATTPPTLTPQAPPEVAAKPTPGLDIITAFVSLITAGVLVRGKKFKH